MGVLVALSAVLLASALAFFLWERSRSAAPPTSAQAVADLPESAARWSAPLAAAAAVTKFGAAYADAGGLGQQLGRAARDLAARARQADIALRQPQWEPRVAPPLAPAALLTLPGQSREQVPKSMYSLEFCAALVAALRSAGASLAVVELQAGAGVSATSPDPSGYLGYYGIAEQADGERPPRLFDPFAAVASEAEAAVELEPLPVTANGQVLSDDQVAAAFLGLEALSQLRLEPAVALTEVDAALRLWPRSAVLRSIHARVLSVTAGVSEAEREARAALQLRPDAPRHLHLATYLVEQGDVGAAQAELAQALVADSAFAPAQLLTAALSAAKGQVDEAKATVMRLIQTQPDLPGVFLTAAQIEAAGGDLPAAITLAEKALVQRPESPEVYLALAQLHLAAGDRPAMREQLRRLLAVTVPGRQAEVKAQLVAMFGAGALSEVEAADTTPEESADEPGAETTGDLGADGTGDAADLQRDLDQLRLSPGAGLLAPTKRAPAEEQGSR